MEVQGSAVHCMWKIKMQAQNVIYVSSPSVPDFCLIEADNSKALNNVKLNTTTQLESVSLFTVGAVYLVYASW